MLHAYFESIIRLPNERYKNALKQFQDNRKYMEYYTK